MKALMTIVKKIFPIVLIVGVICWAFGIAYTGLTIIHQEQIQYGTYTWTYWRFDVKEYLQSLEHSLTDATALQVIPNAPKLPSTPNWKDVIAILKWAFNSFFIYAFNWIIYALNIAVLAPIKIVLYPVNIFYALFGLNTAEADYIKATQMIYTFKIPNIPNI